MDNSTFIGSFLPSGTLELRTHSYNESKGVLEAETPIGEGCFAGCRQGS